MRSLALLLCLSAFASGQEIRFDDVTDRVGLRKPLAGLMGHGAAWGDLNSDGLPDLYVGGFADRPDAEYAPASGPVPSRLLIQREGTFELVPNSPAGAFARTSGAVWVDLDGDGDDDLYSANNAKDRVKPDAPEPQKSAKVRRSDLLRNDDGTLIVIDDRSGTPERIRTARNVAVLDYDLDGTLDLFVVEDVFIKGPSSRLLRGLGELRYEDVTEAAGLPDDLFGLGCAVADVNGDRHPDIFVGHSNRFFLSDGNGGYTEPSGPRATFAWEELHNEDWPCGAAFADLNRDGQLDLVLAIHGEPARNKVFLHRGLDSDGVPKFEDVTRAAGLPESIPLKTPHIEVQDFDNDGWPDLYFSAGIRQKSADDQGTIRPLVFRSRGVPDGKPGGVPTFAAPYEIDEADDWVYFPAGPSCDYDRDGRVDLFLVNWFSGNRSRLLRNVTDAGHWLTVSIRTPTPNRIGIGSRVEVYRAGELGKAAALLGCAEITTGYGYASGQEPVCHFGLGQAAEVDLRVTLPGGRVIERTGIKAGQRIVVE